MFYCFDKKKKKKKKKLSHWYCGTRFFSLFNYRPVAQSSSFTVSFVQICQDIMRLSREAQKIVRNLLIFALFLSVAILFYHFYEGWAVSKCLVFAIETMTTIGICFTSLFVSCCCLAFLLIVLLLFRLRIRCPFRRHFKTLHCIFHDFRCVCNFWRLE
jgi:hypothetical protein